MFSSSIRVSCLVVQRVKPWLLLLFDPPLLGVVRVLRKLDLTSDLLHDTSQYPASPASAPCTMALPPQRRKEPGHGVGRFRRACWRLPELRLSAGSLACGSRLPLGLTENSSPWRGVGAAVLSDVTESIFFVTTSVDGPRVTELRGRRNAVEHQTSQDTIKRKLRRETGNKLFVARRTPKSAPRRAGSPP